MRSANTQQPATNEYSYFSAGNCAK